MSLKNQDPEIFNIICAEKERELETLNLIASENYASFAVLEVCGSVLTNKYAEGYPGERYYGGCEFIDKAEESALCRAKKLFGAEHVNVQPHSGTQANIACYFAVLKPGDIILGQSLISGGHLTHGSKVNFSGVMYNAVSYESDPRTGRLDYNKIEKKAQEYKPKMIICGASAYPRIIDFQKFREIADKIDAYLLADIAHIAGLVVCGLHPSPVPYADFVTTTTHKTLRGPRGGMIMCKRKYAEAIDKAVFPGTQGGPQEHIIAAKAVCFAEALKPQFRQYQKQIISNANTLVESLKELGIKLVSDGTDNHLILLDLRNLKITGNEAEKILEEAAIIVNKNTIPGDLKTPKITSGIRIGTPAVTSRGMKEKEMEKIGGWISECLKNKDDKKFIQSIREEVEEFCNRFPVPGIE